jgi:hypothetical protein
MEEQPAQFILLLAGNQSGLLGQSTDIPASEVMGLPTWFQVGKDNYVWLE